MRNYDRRYLQYLRPMLGVGVKPIVIRNGDGRWVTNPAQTHETVFSNLDGPPTWTDPS